MFVQTTRPDILIGDRCYAAGSVVDVSDRRAEDLIKLGHGVAHAGPAGEPQVKVERADLKAKLSQAEKRG